MNLARRVKQKAAELGFNRVGIIRAEPSPTLHAYSDWIAANYHGQMGYLAREDRLVRRQDLNIILPNVQSLILVALDYTTLTPPENILNDPRRGRISNYAWGVDYHEVMLPRLQALGDWLQQELGDSQQIEQRIYVDTGAILERSHAQQAGLGFVGKNTMLIHPQASSYFFLGELLTTYNFAEYDEPHRETMCGSCTRCLTACPTNAFPQPYQLDARRCISYLTIELKTTIPVEMRSLMGNWVYGCDVCQTVCPWNRFAMQTAETEFFPADIENVAPPLIDLLQLDTSGFKERFANSPILRIKRERLVRNACVAAGNSGLVEFIPILQSLANEDESDLVRDHAQGALQRLSN